MRIEDGLDLPGNKVDIPDCGRGHLPEFLFNRGLLTGAEIGVWKGEYTEVLLKSGLTVNAIDPWRYYEDCQWYGPEDFLENAHLKAMRRLSPWIVDGKCRVFRKTSMEALNDFEDGSLDWVYIDGNHALPYVANDIYFWSRKVRSGGVISGHDYIFLGSDPFRCNVKVVVDAYAYTLKLKYYILGSRAKVEGTVRDRERSWFWFNP